MTATTGGISHFDMGRVFTRTFGVVGANFLPFFVLALLFGFVPAVVVAVGPEYLSPDLDTQAEGGIKALAGILQFGLSYVLAAALTRGTIDDLDGRKASIGKCLTTGLKYAFPAFIVALVGGVAVLLGLILFVIPGIIMAIAWSMSTPALVIERTGIFGALSRSAQLTRGHRWALLGLMICFVLVMIAILILVGAVGAGVGFAVGEPHLATQIGSALGGSLGALLGAVMFTTAYAELRGARDGVGVSELASVFD